MTHTPVLTVIDEPDTPRMAIIQRCKECNIEVSRHTYDASQGESAGRAAMRDGEEDGYAWLKHVSEGQA